MMTRLRDTPTKKMYFNTVSKGRLINRVEKLNLSEGKNFKDSTFKVSSTNQVNREVNFSESEDESDADMPEIHQKTQQTEMSQFQLWDDLILSDEEDLESATQDVESVISPSQDSLQYSPQDSSKDSGLGSSPDQAMESDLSADLPEIHQKTNKGFYIYKLKKWSNELVTKN